MELSGKPHALHPFAPTARTGDPTAVAADANKVVAQSGGWAPIAQTAGYLAGRAAPFALGALGAGGGIAGGLAIGSLIPGAARSLYNALPLPGNENTPIRQAGAAYRQDFYNDLSRGKYGHAVNDALMASGLTLGRFISDLPPAIPDRER